jgi:hypothetical protein
VIDEAAVSARVDDNNALAVRVGVFRGVGAYAAGMESDRQAVGGVNRSDSAIGIDANRVSVLGGYNPASAGGGSASGIFRTTSLVAILTRTLGRGSNWL